MRGCWEAEIGGQPIGILFTAIGTAQEVHDDAFLYLGGFNRVAIGTKVEAMSASMACNTSLPPRRSKKASSGRQLLRVALVVMATASAVDMPQAKVSAMINARGRNTWSSSSLRRRPQSPETSGKDYLHIALVAARIWPAQTLHQSGGAVGQDDARILPDQWTLRNETSAWTRGRI